MKKYRKLWALLTVLLLGSMLLTACQTATEEPTEPPMEEEATAPPAQEDFVLGMLLVGPFNDRGWSQAHYEAGLYMEENIPQSELIYIDKVNPADRPGTTAAQLGEDLLDQGANLIVFNSDDMKDGALEFAQNNPDVPVIHISGDFSWEEGENFKGQENLANVMGNMTYGKMIAGCAAALKTQNGDIGYLGPLINDETRRLAASAYLGAQYCYENYRGEDPADLGFKVTWIGFWFNIPGVTADPTQVADDFYNQGFDVVISGIDTTEALVEANKFAQEGQDVWAIPYDFEGACEEAPDICLGVPYFNWGPDYVEEIMAVKNGEFEMHFEWNEPYWPDINDPDQSPIGFEKGPGLSGEEASQLDSFISELADGLNLWVGPLNLQDGTAYLEDGEEATTQQIWYLPQLLEGMEGQSVPEE